jgi:hypothetical protein
MWLGPMTREEYRLWQLKRLGDATRPIFGLLFRVAMVEPWD